MDQKHILLIDDESHLANRICKVFGKGKSNESSSARILVADDSEEIRSMLRLMLEEEGYEVEEASNGRAAIKLQKEKPSDLIIIDIIMPEKEGIETIKELRQNFPKIKIIAISGGGICNPEDYLIIAKKMGAEITLAKPFRRLQLLKAIRGLLS